MSKAAYTPNKCNAKAIVKRNCEKARQERKTRSWHKDDGLHGTLELGELVASAGPVNTREVWR